MIIGLANFGHAVKSIDEVTQVYTKLWGFSPPYRFSTGSEGAANAIFPVVPNFAELLEPTDATGPLAKFLSRRGEGMYHFTLIVDDVEKEVNSLRRKGVQVMDAAPIGKQHRAWLHPRSTMGVLIELVDKDPLAERGLQNAPRQGLIAKVSHLHHIVKDLDAAVKMYETVWGLKPHQRHRYPGEGFQNAIIRIGSNYIGILSPLKPDNPLSKFLERWGDGLRSVCFTVDNMDEAIASLRAKGVEVVVNEPSGHTPFKAAWVSPRFTRGLVVELFPHKESASYMARESQ